MSRDPIVYGRMVETYAIVIMILLRCAASCVRLFSRLTSSEIVSEIFRVLWCACQTFPQKGEGCVYLISFIHHVEETKEEETQRFMDLNYR